MVPGAISWGPRRQIGPRQMVELQAEQLRTCLTKEGRIGT